MDSNSLMAKDPLISILGSPQELFHQSAIFLNQLQPSVSWFCDHICYRVETVERYKDLKRQLKDHCEHTNESLIKDRPISLFLCPHFMSGSGLQTQVIELPSPKPGRPYKEGWEHLEIVVPSLQTFIRNNPDCSFETSALSKPINPEISVKISKDFKIKFHEASLLDIVAREKFAKKSWDS